MVKQQQRFWIRIFDAFLPKSEQKQRVIDRYRSRAMVRTAFLGSLLNPALFLFEFPSFELWLRLSIALTLMLIPLGIVWLYRTTSWLKVSAGLYIVMGTGFCAAAQLAVGTIHALYWIWVPFFIVFSVLMLGLKSSALYTAATTVLFAWILQESAKNGHVLGLFPDAEALLASLTLHVLVIQLCFLLFMVAYDVIRNRAEVRAVLLRFTDEEAARLATVGERMGTMAQELHEQLQQFQTQLAQLEGLSKRSDTPVAEVQMVVRDMQEKSRKLREISQQAQG
jgi:hypothetical protein